MHFFWRPIPLWFLGAGGSEIQKSVTLAGGISASTSTTLDFIGETVDFSVGVNYLITCSVAPLSSTELEMSAIAYRLSASIAPAILVSVDYAGQAFGPLQGFLTATPIYQLDIAGQVDKTVNAAYNASASMSATITPFTSVVLAGAMSASLSAVLLIADNTSINLAGGITASANIILQIQSDNIEKVVNLAGQISGSTLLTLVVPPAGGLVWSRTKQRYIAVRVGS